MTTTQIIVLTVFLVVMIPSAGVMVFLVLPDALFKRRPSRRRLMEQAWQAEMASAQAFAEGHRRMMNAAFNYHWNRRYGGGR